MKHKTAGTYDKEDYFRNVVHGRKHLLQDTECHHSSEPMSGISIEELSSKENDDKDG